MKQIITYIAGILFLSAFYSCNSDVFIEEIQPSVSEIELDGNGDAATISLSSSNWNIVGGYANFEGLSFSIYNAEGTEIGQTGVTYLEGFGKLVLNDEELPLIIERKQAKEISIKVEENAKVYPFRLALIVGNEYEVKEIHITVSPCDRYIFDTITYTLDTYEIPFYNDFTETSIVVNNNYGQTIETTLYPYRNENKDIAFVPDSPNGFSLLGEKDFAVAIPTMADEALIMNGEKAVYTAHQSLPFSFANEEKIISIPPQTSQRITTVVLRDAFATAYTISAHNPKTQKQRIITGKIQSISPREYFIKRETLEQQP